jgi:SWI/SNF-related matrix-associated actin-dependent regulator of chromatin subfamily A3
MTGTPIQNNLSDLQSLFKFLRVYSYDDKDTFQTHFTSLWASGKGVLTTNRLKQVLGYIMLRRSSSHIELPARKDLKMFLSFDEPERDVYRVAKEKALNFIDDLLNSQKVARSYKNAVQKINHLRLICNHGLWQPDNGYTDLKSEVDISTIECWSSTAAQRALNRFSSLGLQIACIECKSLVDIDVTNDDQLLRSTPSMQLHLTRCLRLWCSSCYSSRQALSRSLSFCNCDTKCPVATVQLDAISRSPSPFVVVENGHHEQRTYPTKIRALLDDVKKVSSSIKR